MYVRQIDSRLLSNLIETRKLCYRKDVRAMRLIYITGKSQSNLGRAASPPLTQTIALVTMESPKLSSSQNCLLPSTITTKRLLSKLIEKAAPFLSIYEPRGASDERQSSHLNQPTCRTFTPHPPSSFITGPHRTHAVCRCDPLLHMSWMSAMAVLCWGQEGTGPPNLAQAPNFFRVI